MQATLLCHLIVLATMPACIQEKPAHLNPPAAPARSTTGGDNVDSVRMSPTPSKTDGSGGSQGDQYGHSAIEIALSIGVLGFGVVLFLIQSVIIAKTGKGWNLPATRISGLTLIITAGLFLITAGYSQNQTAGMVGLLGTIAGYLLGKADPSAKSDPKSDT